MAAALTGALAVAAALRFGDRRVKSAASLLAALETAGAVVSVPLEARAVAYGGHGIFTGAPVRAGARIMSLPKALWLTAPDEAGLPLALARERRSPSSPVFDHYLASLPTDCPANLATRPAADLALANASLHGWKVELMEREARQLASEIPLATAEEVRWLLCMKQSRAFGGDSEGPRMLPYFDLLNHNDADPTVREVTDAHGSALVALRDLQAGEELAFS